MGQDFQDLQVYPMRIFFILKLLLIRENRFILLTLSERDFSHNPRTFEAVSKESILCQEENKISTAGFFLRRGKREWVITKKSKFYFLTNIGQPLLRQPQLIRLKVPLPT